MSHDSFTYLVLIERKCSNLILISQPLPDFKFHLENIFVLFRYVSNMLPDHLFQLNIANYKRKKARVPNHLNIVTSCGAEGLSSFLIFQVG